MALVSVCAALCFTFHLSAGLQYKPVRELDGWLAGLEPISVGGAAVTPPCRVFRVDGAPDGRLDDRSKPSVKHVAPSDWLLGKFPARGASSRLVEALRRHKSARGRRIDSDQRRHSDSSSSSSEED